MRHFSKMTEGELSELVSAGNKVLETLNTPGYREVLAPRLKESETKAETAARWMPGKTTELGAIGLTAVYKDGRISGLNEIDTIVKDIQADKAEALKELHRRKEKAGK